LGHVQHPTERKLKVLFFENIAAGHLGHQDQDTHNAILDSAKLLSSLGHEVEIQKFPFDIEGLKDDFLNYYGLLAYALRNLGGLFLDSKPDKKRLEPFTTGLSKQFGRNILRIRRSLKRLRETGVMIDSYFGKYDILMTPVLSHSVPRIGHFDITLSYPEIAQRAVAFASYTGMQNVTGSPAISLPLATASTGLPLGIHFGAAYGQDKLLLELAYQLEAAKPWKFIYNS
jgi:amidase